MKILRVEQSVRTFCLLAELFEMRNTELLGDVIFDAACNCLYCIIPGLLHDTEYRKSHGSRTFT